MIRQDRIGLKVLIPLLKKRIFVNQRNTRTTIFNDEGFLNGGKGVFGSE